MAPLPAQQPLEAEHRDRPQHEPGRPVPPLVPALRRCGRELPRRLDGRAGLATTRSRSCTRGSSTCRCRASATSRPPPTRLAAFAPIAEAMAGSTSRRRSRPAAAGGGRRARDISTALFPVIARSPRCATATPPPRPVRDVAMYDAMVAMTDMVPFRGVVGAPASMAGRARRRSSGLRRARRPLRRGRVPRADVREALPPLGHPEWLGTRASRTARLGAPHRRRDPARLEPGRRTYQLEAAGRCRGGIVLGPATCRRLGAIRMSQRATC